jgi:hypothetical protein
MDKILIGLVAPKRSGKDTAANYLCSSYGFKKYNFADPLKKGIGEIFGFSYEQLEGKNKEIIDPFWGVTPRELFQKIGTELFQYELPKIIDQFKDFDRTFWVKCFERWYITKKEEYEINRNFWANGAFENMLKDLPSNFFDTTKPNFRVVVADVRFKHEADKLKEMGGILIRVNRKTEENDYSSHSSELGIDDIECDHTIENDGFIIDLYEQLDEIIKNLILS